MAILDACHRSIEFSAWIAVQEVAGSRLTDGTYIGWTQCGSHFNDSGNPIKNILSIITSQLGHTEPALNCTSLLSVYEF